MMVGGRNLGSSSPSRVKLTVAGLPGDEWAAAPGFFLRMIQLPPAPAAGGGDYVNVSIAAWSTHGSASPPGPFSCRPRSGEVSLTW